MVCWTFNRDIIVSMICKDSPAEYCLVQCMQWVNHLSKCMQKGLTEVCLTLLDTLDALSESQGIN